MIDHLADRIALKIKENSEDETVSVEVMKFALIGILHNLITISFSLIIGMILGEFTGVLLTVISFMLLRLFSGGYHFKSAFSCFVFSSFIFISVPFIQVNLDSLIILNTFSLLLCIIFAPSNIREHIRVPEKYFFLFKLLSLVIVILNYFLDNPIITLSFLAQSVTLITLKREEVKAND